MRCPVRSGLIEFAEALSTCKTLPLASFKEDEDRVIFSIGVRYVSSNGVIEKKENALTKEDIDRIAHDFKSKKLPFIWWSGNPLLKRDDFVYGGAMKGIALDVTNTPTVDAPKGITLKKVESLQELHDYGSVRLAHLELLPEDVDNLQKIHTTLWQQGKLIYFVAYDNDKPVSTAMLSALPNSAGIWSCTTLQDYRKKGIQTALTAMACVEAYKRHYKKVIATLLPSAMAWNVFHKLGFKEVADMPFYEYRIN